MLRHLAVTALLAASLSACGGGSDPADVAAPASLAPTAAVTKQAPTSAEPKPSPTSKPSRCTAASPALLAAIAEGKEGADFTLTKGFTVKSKDYSKVYMIAATFAGGGLDGKTAVWATNSLEPGTGLILAVDGFAKEFTSWPEADKTDAKISQSADGVSAAAKCADK